MSVSIVRQLAGAHRWLLALLALACVAGLVACAGGSGSSGFDITAENLAIDEALDSNECQINDGLIICPSSGGTPTQAPATATATSTPFAVATPTTTGPPPETTATPTVFVPPTATTTRAAATATPDNTPVPDPYVETSLGDSDIAQCVVELGDGDCVLLFSFEPIGFDAATGYEVAYRTRNPDSEWIVLPAPDLFAAIPLEPGLQYQLAVLVYEDAPPTAAGPVTALGTTKATWAFVTPVLLAEDGSGG